MISLGGMRISEAVNLRLFVLCIIYKCERILKDNSLAHALLPTQNGFFFGSTDYDGWYFSDVKDCLKQMKQFLKLFKKPGTAYVIFSW